MAEKLNSSDIIVVVSKENEEHIKKNINDNIKVVIQEDRNGTGGAVKVAVPYLNKNNNKVLIMYGDVPLITYDTYNGMINNENDLVVLGFYTKDISFSELKQQFFFFKKAQGLSERTIKDYKNTFSVFEKYYNKDEVNLQEIKQKLLEMFVPLSQGAPATFNKPFANLNCFFNWAVTNEYIEKNPLRMTGLKKKKDTGKIRNVPNDVINKLLKNIDINTYIGLRDYVFIVLTLDTGIRPSEACGLELTDLDLEHFELEVRPIIAKTRIRRVLPLSYQTVEILKRFISIREDNWAKYLFLTIDGKQFSTNAWEFRTQSYSKRINYRFTPYDLRHTFAILYLKNGGNVFALQKLLGHTDLTMTKRYVNFVQSDINEQHITASPVNNFIQRTTRIKRLMKNVIKEVGIDE